MSPGVNNEQYFLVLPFDSIDDKLIIFLTYSFLITFVWLKGLRLLYMYSHSPLSGQHLYSFPWFLRFTSHTHPILL